MVGLRNDGLVREGACLYASVDSSFTFHCPTFLSSNDAVFSITRRPLCKPRVGLVSKCYFGPRGHSARAREGRSPASQGRKLTCCTTARHSLHPYACCHYCCIIQPLIDFRPTLALLGHVLLSEPCGSFSPACASDTGVMKVEQARFRCRTQ